MGARSGRVHDEVARVQQQWRDLLGREAQAAADQGELHEGAQPDQIAFELGVILAGTDIVSVLHDDLGVLERARSAIRDRLGVQDDSPKPLAAPDADQGHVLPGLRMTCDCP